MYRKSIYEEKEKLKNSLVAIEDQLKLRTPVTEIPNMLKSDFQEKEIDYLIKNIGYLSNISDGYPLQKWLKTSSVLFFLLLLANTIILFSVVSLGVQSGMDFSEIDTDFSLSFFFSFIGIFLFIPVIVNSFKESYFWFSSSFLALAVFVMIISEIFVIFSYKSIFFYLPYMFFITIFYIVYKIYFKEKRQHQLYLQRKIEKTGFDLSTINKYLNV